jgi:hypothetical protein
MKNEMIREPTRQDWNRIWEQARYEQNKPVEKPASSGFLGLIMVIAVLVISAYLLRAFVQFLIRP